jgi:4'-phosphopantetheinyl transferase
MPILTINFDNTIIASRSINELFIQAASLPLQGLTQLEQGRYLKFASNKRQREFVAGRYLARQCLSQLTNTSAQNWLIQRSTKGAPIAICQERHDFGDTYLSITHGELFCAVAVSNRPIGIDLQQIEPLSRWQAIQTRVFSERELSAMQYLNDEERSIRFTELWAIKEAFGKFHGIGLKPKANREISFATTHLSSQSHAVSIVSNGYIFSIVKEEMHELANNITEQSLNASYWLMSSP